MKVSSRLIDVALHTPAPLRKDRPGRLYDSFGLRWQERLELGDHLRAAHPIGCWHRLLKGLQNPREDVVKLSRIKSIDGDERWREWRVVEPARQDGFS
jgi:hypothetical protein